MALKKAKKFFTEVNLNDFALQAWQITNINLK
jgi:hypothetical protein